MLTLFLFQRELDLLKNEYLTSVDTSIQTQILKDIEHMIEAIKDIKGTWEERGFLHPAKNPEAHTVNNYAKGSLLL